VTNALAFYSSATYDVQPWVAVDLGIDRIVAAVQGPIYKTFPFFLTYELAK
jgi:hypothetical protein